MRMRFLSLAAAAAISCCSAFMTVSRQRISSRRYTSQLSGEWEDLSEGQGRCMKRVLVASTQKDVSKPRHGAVCNVRWTAWLEKNGTRGGRVGMLQPNATIEFTLGGGSSETTRAWDAAVATMVPGDVVEIFATHEYAFGEGAEPHVPARASLFFEVALDSWTDFAVGQETVYGLAEAENDDEESALKGELERVADLEEEKGTILEDLGGVKPTMSSTNDLDMQPPVPIEGKGQGYSWTETPTELFLAVESNRPQQKILVEDVTLDLTPTSLALFLRDTLVLQGKLEGRIKVEECTWAISDDGLAVDVYLAKSKPTPDPKKQSSLPRNVQVSGSLADMWATVFSTRQYPPPTK